MLQVFVLRISSKKRGLITCRYIAFTSKCQTRKHQCGQACFHFCHIQTQRSHWKDKCSPGHSHSDREVAFVHCGAVPNIARDVTGVAKLITEIRSDLNIFLAGSLYIGEHQAKRIRRCWRKLHHGSPTISVWGCPMGSAVWLRAERSTCGVPFLTV